MVLPNEASKKLIEKFPSLKKTSLWSYYNEETKWANYMLEKNSKEALDFTKLMTVLTSYITDELNSCTANREKTREVFSLIELFLNKGDKDVKDAATTNFLENLINYTSSGRLKPEQFIHYLGPKSKAYCKAWDEFTGVKTPGLWDE